ncbi:MAG TPA: hypothetical protein VHW09_03155 [Bryobacteraceae bacterium]|nr:hypothetical protein [Bryobacteraceae bacterium]
MGAAFFGAAFFTAFLGAAFLTAFFGAAFFGAAFFGAAFFGAAFLAAFFTGLAAFFAGFFLVAILIYLEHSYAPLCGSSHLSSLACGTRTIIHERARMMRALRCAVECGDFGIQDAKLDYFGGGSRRSG